MLIKIVPPVAALQSAVIFSVVFEDLGQDLSNPQSWSNLLNYLRRDQLDVPELIHALDKSAGILCLLEEVIFDISTMTISCQFVDGLIEQWSLTGCLEVLEKILLDVNQSAMDIEREQELAIEKEKERERRHTDTFSVSAPTKVTRHKKQRSLLMTLVASIIPLHSLSSSSRLPSPPPTPISDIPPTSSISPRARRRRARSELVNAFRRYVLAELSPRFPRGGYYAWIIQSMLRRATDAMESIVTLAKDLPGPDTVTRYYPEQPEFFSITAASLPPTPSVSDDDGLDTDTDGSSVHTPSSALSSNSQYIRCPDGYFTKHHNDVSESLRSLLSPDDLAEYSEKATLVNRLRHLLIAENARQVQAEDDLKHHYDVLEIRSRRRAWLNKALVGGVRSESTDIGMAMPFKSSPLAVCSWSSTDYEYIPHREQDYDEHDSLEPIKKRTKRSTPTTRLFPVSEEEEEAILDTRELETHLDGFELDLESGIPWAGYDDEEDLRLALEVERPQIRPRVRTSSMYRHPIEIPTQPAPVSVTRPQQRLTPSSILCQPLSIPSTVHEEVEQPPSYTEVDVNLNISQFGKFADDEFTLAMDLPFTMRLQDQDVFADRRSLSVDLEHGWIPPGMSGPMRTFRCR